MFGKKSEVTTNPADALAARRTRLEQTQVELGRLQAVANATRSVRLEQQAAVDRLHADGGALLQVTDEQLEAKEARLRQAMRDEATAANALADFQGAHAGLEAELESIRIEETALVQEQARETYRETVRRFLAAGNQLQQEQTDLEAQFRAAARLWPGERILVGLGFAAGTFSGASGTTLWDQVLEAAFASYPELFPDTHPTRQRVEGARARQVDFQRQCSRPV